MENETWKTISGYEGYYKISSKGRVKSLDRTVKQGCSFRKVKSRYKKYILELTGTLVLLFVKTENLEVFLFTYF